MSRHVPEAAPVRRLPLVRIFGSCSVAVLLLAATGFAATSASAEQRALAGEAHVAGHFSGGGYGYGYGGGYGGGHRYHGSYGYGSGYGHGYGSGYGHGYGSGYGHGYRGGYGHGHHRYYRRHHHHGGRTLLGIGIGLLMYDLYDRSRHRAAGDPGDRSSAYGQSRAPQVVVVKEESSRAPYAETSPSVPQPAGDCLQEREYQTTITIGGQEHEAYGTACLMPDGSWRMGAPRLVPEE